jgi:undecaprenyl-diphosphatase
MPFVVYRVLLGVVIMVLLGTGVLSAEGGTAVAQGAAAVAATNGVGL